MNTEVPGSRPRALGILAVVWLALLSALGVLDYVRLSRPPDAHAATAQTSQIAGLERHVAALQATVSTLRRQPTVVTAGQYEATERAQDVRLARIETSLADVVHVGDIAPLGQQLTHVTAEIWRLRHPVPARPRPVVHERAANPAGAPQPVEAPPPFIVLGTELRGGEAFLTVAPRDAQSLSQARVLRLGEADGSWTLEAIDGRTAVFVTPDRVVRVPIP